MLREWISQWIGEQDPEKLRQKAYVAQVLIGAAAIGALIWVRSRDTPSVFRTSAKPKPSRPGEAPRDLLAQAKLQPKPAEPLRLTGIRIDAPPHEILGVSPQATEDEIRKAYRERMKQYHPDAVGRPGTREWEAAQKIAEAINRAKDQLLSRR